jgi:hypothetical protein
MRASAKKALLVIVLFFIAPFVIYGILRYDFPYRSDGEVRAFAESHTLAGLKDPKVFRETFFPGCPDCNDMTDYVIWREQHPNYRPSE